MNNLLYIHGYNSSPLSLKAKLTEQYMSKHYPNVSFHCPQLANKPLCAIEQLEQIIQGKPTETWYLIGSSLGGYFSTYLAEKYEIKSVLINPAIKPYELLESYMGPQVNPYTQEKFIIEPSFIDDLMSLEQIKLSKNNYMVMVQTGDEVLDYRLAVEKYNGQSLMIKEGGDHSFIHYDQTLPDMVKFFNL